MDSQIHPPSDYRRDSELWFDDGNIVLETEGVAFKVYRGNLARHSSVFASMLSFPRPDSSSMEQYDGCPIVHMPDSAEHMRYFLAAINDFSFGERIAESSFPEVNGVLRLAAKYDVAYLRTCAGKRLSAWYPDRLDAYTLVQKDPSLNLDLSAHCAALDLARSTQLSVHIPTILWAISTAADQKSIVTANDLSSADKIIILSALLQFQTQLRRDFLPWLYLRADCENWPECLIFGCEAARRLEEGPFLEGPKHFHQYEHTTDRTGICEDCYTAATESCRQGLQNFWERLPSLFDLPSWDELRRDTVLG